ncbi:MAG TPA: serine/threonine-protein kinase [Kofleriaceae bacterium]|nr:serine/threonine-protein kinase [Kofleriaceae bacterium]
MRDARVGNYRIVSAIGEGGMGSVYRAEHVMLGRPAAIKVLLPELSKNPEMVNRFFNEARATAGLQHPGIIEVYDFGYCDDGAAFIVMELLQGTSLKDRLAQIGRMPWPQALWYTRQIANALSAAHRAHIVHRDLKPDNVFLIPDLETGHERVKVLDFGIAKLAADTGSAGLVKTRAGVIMGTPAYMSPQQCRGAGEVDHRADIYSLGCMMFEMMCGRPPFVGEGMGDLLNAHMSQPAPGARQFEPSIPAPVEAIIDKALRKSERERQQTMEELVAELDRAAHSQTGTQPAQTMPASPTMQTVMAPSSTTFTTGAGQVSVAPAPAANRKLPLYVAAGAAVIAGVVIAAVVAGGGGGEAPAKIASVAATTDAGAAVETAPATPPKRKPKLTVVQLTDQDLEDQTKKAEPAPKAVAAAAGSAAALATIDPIASTTEQPATNGAHALSSMLQLVSDTRVGTWIVKQLGDDYLVENLGPEAKLRIESRPSGAEVEYDGGVVGKTPLSITVERGAYDVDVELSLDGYAPRTLTLSAAVDTVRRVQLDHLIKLRILSKPPGAQVSTMGDSLGVTPLEVQVPPSEDDAQSFLLHLDGYLDKTVDIVPEKNGTTTVVLDREPQTIAHELDSIPSGMEVVVAGQVVGKTPYKIEFLEEKGKTREYVLRAPKDSPRYKDTIVRVPADKPFKRTIPLHDICAGRAAEADSATPSLVNPYDPCRTR